MTLSTLIALLQSVVLLLTMTAANPHASQEDRTKAFSLAQAVVGLAAQSLQTSAAPTAAPLSMPSAVPTSTAPLALTPPSTTPPVSPLYNPPPTGTPPLSSTPTPAPTSPPTSPPAPTPTPVIAESSTINVRRQDQVWQLKAGSHAAFLATVVFTYSDTANLGDLGSGINRLVLHDSLSRTGTPPFQNVLPCPNAYPCDPAVAFATAVLTDDGYDYTINDVGSRFLVRLPASNSFVLLLRGDIPQDGLIGSVHNWTVKEAGSPWPVKVNIQTPSPDAVKTTIAE